MTSKHLNVRRLRLQGFFACFSRLCFTQLAYAVHMGVICIQCGARYPTDRQISCKLCEDERGSQRRDGQQWISKERLHDKHKNVLLEEERGRLVCRHRAGLWHGTEGIAHSDRCAELPLSALLLFLTNTALSSWFVHKQDGWKLPCHCSA